MANQINWNPVYIRTNLADKPKQRIDADYWNALWNSVIDQGDNNTGGILLLKTEVEVLIEQFAALSDATTGIIAVATQQANLAEGHQVKAENAAELSEGFVVQAGYAALEAQSWARGGTGTREGEDTDNAKYYSEQIAITADEIAQEKVVFDGVVAKALEDVNQVVSDAEEAFVEEVSTQKTILEGLVIESSNIKDETFSAKSAAATSASEAKIAEINAKAAQTAAEKARDEAQQFAGGDFVTSTEFAESIESLKPAYTEYTMLASGWTENTYSFESVYPSEAYDIEISLSSSATNEMVEAFNSATITGSVDSNIVTAFGDVPTIDILVIVKVVKK